VEGGKKRGGKGKCGPVFTSSTTGGGKGGDSLGKKEAKGKGGGGGGGRRKRRCSYSFLLFSSKGKGGFSPPKICVWGKEREKKRGKEEGRQRDPLFLKGRGGGKGGVSVFSPRSPIPPLKKKKKRGKGGGDVFPTLTSEKKGGGGGREKKFATFSPKKGKGGGGEKKKWNVLTLIFCEKRGTKFARFVQKEKEERGGKKSLLFLYYRGRSN